MTSANKKHATLLTYSGTLPFLGAAMAPLLSGGALNGAHLALSYGAVILSFLAGMHWAVYLLFSERCPCNLLMVSNAVALLAWSTYWFPAVSAALVVQILGFLGLLAVDWKLHRAGLFPTWFFTLRRNATAIVVIYLSIVTGVA